MNPSAQTQAGSARPIRRNPRPADAPLHHEADAEDEREVDEQQAVVDDAEMDEHRACGRCARAGAPARANLLHRAEPSG